MTILDRMNYGFSAVIESVYVIASRHKLLLLPGLYFASIAGLIALFSLLNLAIGGVELSRVSLLFPSDLAASGSAVQAMLTVLFDLSKIAMQTFFSVAIVVSLFAALQGGRIDVGGALRQACESRFAIMLFAVLTEFVFFGIDVVGVLVRPLQIAWMIAAVFVPLLMVRERSLPLVALHDSVQIAIHYFFELLGVATAFLFALLVASVPAIVLQKLLGLFGATGSLLASLLLIVPLLVA
ncbi:MAG TPA: hypothetical protein VI522_01925, partial [Gammaproteobacteria bacterium]|nr:hypothetical protein [Gammaproteobacteria bacterium]